MSQTLLIQITTILGLGIALQWFAWRFRLPSIFVLLVCGLILGPGVRFLDPDALLGDLLLPLVSLSVAVILFEGGLNLRRSELHEVGNVVRNLVTIGCFVTWLIASSAAVFILRLEPGIAFLFGALLVVTGPTVTIPLIRHIRPVGRIGHVIKWEGIVNDPIGAILAVLVYEAIVVGRTEAARHIPSTLGLTLVVGLLLGVTGSVCLILILRPARLPDYLHMHAALAVVLAAFTLSNVLRSESGLIAVTFMGIALANQRWVPVRPLMEFKEHLRVLLLTVLFIVLGARLSRAEIAQIEWLPSLAFLAVLVFIARPLAVWASTWRTKLTRREKLFLCWIAPRGVVAAAVASIFALELGHLNHPQADRLVPLTFLVVIGTVALYGLTASALARRLGLGQPNPQGVLLVGAHPWAREIAKALRAEGVAVRLVDTNRSNVTSARMEALPTHYGSIISERAPEEIELEGIGRLLALTSNDEANALAALHFAEMFGRAEVYQLAAGEQPARAQTEFSPIHLRGRTLFGKGMTYGKLSERFQQGATIRRTTLTREFDYQAFKDLYREKALPLFLITESGHLQIFNADQPITPRPGQKLVSLIDPGIKGPAELIPNSTACVIE